MKGITLQELSDKTVQQLHSNYVRQPAFAHTEGTAAAYTVTLNPVPTSLDDGFGITIIPHVANATNPTLNINGLGTVALKDQKGSEYAAEKLQVGKPYTFRKVGMDFLADSSGGSGSALAGDIRAGKTATTDDGEVKGTLPVWTGGTVVPSVVNQTRQAGVYDEDIVVQGDADLVAGNIKKGVNLFGINGSYEGEKGLIVDLDIVDFLRVPAGATMYKSLYNLGSYRSFSFYGGEQRYINNPTNEYYYYSVQMLRVGSMDANIYISTSSVSTAVATDLTTNWTYLSGIYVDYNNNERCVYSPQSGSYSTRTTIPSLPNQNLFLVLRVVNNNSSEFVANVILKCKLQRK